MPARAQGYIYIYPDRRCVTRPPLVGRAALRAPNPACTSCAKHGGPGEGGALAALPQRPGDTAVDVRVVFADNTFIEVRCGCAGAACRTVVVLFVQVFLRFALVACECGRRLSSHASHPCGSPADARMHVFVMGGRLAFTYGTNADAEARAAGSALLAAAGGGANVVATSRYKYNYKHKYTCDTRRG